ncbi:hypothetical protein GQ43DRAFT_400414 [Delitschia confertaspora ATCC 74209]|uniref:GST N-terminal domain-containing protein n=1 Tax=Delitschia confertaspora ATCC 74209 TaxID=1513339 RepID=A0A9P4MT37_9PLEO|nr:hypothetical protein GQ43DRAFT_400414 [Delitschia confertaspora ATCC 74209]
MSQTILYDLPTKEPCASWSLNPWEARMILNYKKIDYKTEWTEYPDVAPKLKSFGIPPNDKNDPGYFMDYTIPAIRYEDGTYSMDSWKIAQELEKRYPSPSLHLDDPVVVKVRDITQQLLRLLGANILAKIAQILPERSAEYFYRTRKEMFGMTLDEFEKVNGGEQSWEAAKEPSKELAGLLKESGGPFFLGETVSYADFIFVTFLEFLKRSDGETGDLFSRFVAQDKSFLTLYEACGKWLERDN